MMDTLGAVFWSKSWTHGSSGFVVGTGAFECFELGGEFGVGRFGIDGAVGVWILVRSLSVGDV